MNFFYLTVAPLVSSFYENQTYERGDNITFNCSTIGGPDVFYQWQANGIDISGEISITLILINVNASTGGEYGCVVSNSAGDDSASTFVFISPYFTTQPENRGGSNGSKLTLMCKAEAFPAPQYQWARVDGMAIRDAVLGINSTMLSFNPLMFGDDGNYFCNTTSGGITIQSNLVALTGIIFIILCIALKIHPKRQGSLKILHRANLDKHNYLLPGLLFPTFGLWLVKTPNPNCDVVVAYFQHFFP